MTKKIFFKIVILFGLFIILALFIQEIILFDDLKKLNVASYTTLFMGDSVVHTFDWDEEDKTTLGQLIADNDTYILSHGSYNPLIYLDYLEYLVKKNRMPKKVIIGLNLRSFSHNQYPRPIYFFTYERLLLEQKRFKALWYKFSNLFIMNAENQENLNKQYFNQTVDYYGVPIGTVKDYFIWLNGDEHDFDSRMKDWFIFIYLYKIDENHSLFHALKSIDLLCEQENVTLLIYVTPIDYQKGEIYVSDFDEIINNNIQFLKNNLHYTIFYDFSQTLPSSSFMYTIMPDEHLNSAGRNALSKMINDVK